MANSKTGKPFGKKKNRILYTVYAAMTVILAICICCAITGYYPIIAKAVGIGAVGWISLFTIVNRDRI